MIRLATHSGSWYTGEASQLNEELSGWLKKVPETTEDGISIPVKGARAIIAPHAGYAYSGPAAAYAYKCIEIDFVKRVFILGPSHNVNFDGCVVSPCRKYQTPLGDLTLDTEVMEELRGTGHFTEMTKSVDEAEHSIEMHLPYIYKILESKIDSIRIVPIMVGALDASREAFYGRLLSPYLENPSNLFIVSSDFCHWGNQFSYTYYSDGSNPSTHLSHQSSSASLPIPIHQSIENLDRQGMSIIERINHREFASYLSKTKNTICGRHPISVFLCAVDEFQKVRSAKENGSDDAPKIRFIHYAQSSRVTSEKDSSVSYASAFVYLP